MATTKQESTQADEGFSLISNAKLLSLYATMRACRQAAEQGAHSILGHEAAVVGAVIDLLPEDKVATTLLPESLVHVINARVTVDAALDSGTKGITVVLASPREMPLALWRKTVDRAIHEKLPVLFVSLVAGTQPRRYTPPKIRGYAFPSIAVDGHDVVAVYRVASEAIAHARKGHGPTLIESVHLNAGCPLRNMEDYLAAKGLSLVEP